MASAAAERLVGDLAAAMERHGSATWVAAGGGTPALAYDALAERYAQAVPWRDVKVLMGDERCVPPDDPESNWRQLAERLTSKLLVPQENLLRPPAELGAEVAAERYAEVLRGLESDPEGKPRLDLVWLGMGEDGHTLSLFPGHASLDADDLVLPVYDSPKPPPERITLGLSALEGAASCAILATGPGKREAVASAMSGEAELPVVRAAQAVERGGGAVLWLLDEQAAAGI